MLLVRIVHFLFGGALAGGGGFLAWTERARFDSIFPPDPAASPWMLIAGVGGLAAGLVFLVSALAPRPKRAARLAAQAARRREMLAAADAFYAERSRAVDRDWRSGDLPPSPAADPAPVKQPPVDPPRQVHAPAAPEPPRNPPPPPAAMPAPELVLATRADSITAKPPPEPAQATPRPTALKPVATGIPPARPDSPFPSMATLTPIPRAIEQPPPVSSAPAFQPTMPGPGSTGAEAASGADPFSDIRAAIAQGRLAEADRLLTIHREKAQGAALAELTGLAGDHAAAAGRTSNAKWLWRLALKRFGEINAMDSPAARAVSERLRLADN
jgi:hypothetical protein